MNHLGSLVIETEHLYLRPFVLEDAPAMFENWASDPETLKYVTWDAHASTDKNSLNRVKNSYTINFDQSKNHGKNNPKKCAS